MDCPICQAEQKLQDQVWYAYAQRRQLRDALRAARSAFPEAGIESEDVQAHLREHAFIQPSPLGDGLDRSQALQEALTSFPRYWFYLLLAVYRGQALSLNQIYRLFYLDHAEDSEHLRAQVKSDLQRLSFRSFLFQVWPQALGTLHFEDPGPYYFLGRQAVPLIERLEGMQPGTLPFQTYITSQQQVEEFYLERDVRFVDVIVSLRENLYRRRLDVAGEECNVHLAIENWYAPIQLHTDIGQEQGAFSPSGLIGLRAENRDSSFSTLLPIWFEYDRGTEDAEEFVKSIFLYPKYYDSEHYNQMFPILAEYQTPGPLIILCEDAFRREEVGRLLGVTLGKEQAPIYLTERPSLLKDPYADGILVPPGEGTQRFSLIQAAVEHCKPLLDNWALPGSGHLTDLPPRQLLERNDKTPDPVIEDLDLQGWG